MGWGLVAQLAIVAHAPPTATVCAPFEVTVAASTSGRIAPLLALPLTSRLEVLERTVTTRVEQDGAGRPLAIAEATFRLATPVTGRLALPGARVEAGGIVARSAPLSIAVGPRAAEDEEPLVSVEAHLEPDRGGGVLRTFVGEQIDYVVDVRLNAAARRAMRHNPTFFPPDMPAVLAYDLAAMQPPRDTGPPRCFQRLTYRRALFPLFAGRTVIAPAVVTYGIAVSPSYFSREELHELRSDSVSIEIAEPPRAGRPAAFDGAVGVLRATSRLDATSGRMGDPLVLTVRIDGAGNVKLLPRPALALDWAAVLPSGERVVVDSTHAVVRGEKEFDWLITPRTAGPHTISLAPYSFFDPSRAAYDSTSAAPLSVNIAAAPLAPSDTTVPRPRVAIRTLLRPEAAPPLTERPEYWLLFALAPVPAAVRRAARGRRRQGRPAPAASRLARAAASDMPLDARQVRALFVDALRERVPGALRPGMYRATETLLLEARVTARTADDAERLLAALDRAAFGAGGPITPELVAEAARLVRAIDAEAIARPSAAAGRGPGALGRLALIASLGSIGVDAQEPARSVAAIFAHGVRAYQAGQDARARYDFAQVVARVPRAPDAWANLGDAAWKAGDTAQASLAWQRGLRVDPRDVDLRGRLALLPAPPSAGDVGFVAPIPVDFVAVAALATWVAGWLGMACFPGGRAGSAGGARTVALVAVVAAVAMLGGAFALQVLLDGRSLAVLRRTTPTRTEVLSSSATGDVGTIGELARIGARAGLWTHVTLGEGRAGWVPADALLPLAERAAN